MKKISARLKHSLSYYFSLATLGLLLAAIFFTINHALQEQRIEGKAQTSLAATDEECKPKVVKTAERIPENQQANAVNVATSGFKLTGSPLGKYGGDYESRVTGNFTGTTDEILQWGACKWGFEPDTARAIAYGLSKWKQSDLKDCNNQGQIQPETRGCQSVGIMRVKSANIPPTHPGTWPHAKNSTSFNVDYALAFIRACIDGKQTTLGNGYTAGDESGCIGAWYSGLWHDNGAEGFRLEVQQIKANREWYTIGAGAAPSGTMPNTGVAPTFGALGPCPSCETPSMPPPNGTNNTLPVNTVPSTSVIDPVDTSNPCVSAEYSLAHDKKKKYKNSKHKTHDGAVSDIGELLLKFLVALLNMLLTLFGSGTVDLPNATTPNTNSTVPNTDPCDPVSPTTMPSQPIDTTSQTPSQTPSLSLLPSPLLQPSQPANTNDQTAATCTGSASAPTGSLSGYRLTKCEDFNGTSIPSGWTAYEGGGGDTVVGVGRKAQQCTVGGGVLTQTQNADGATCGMSSNFGQKYGYWEVKMRAYTTGTGSGSAPHPVLILWPDSDVWDDGELDYFESDIGDAEMGVFLHCVGNASSNCYTKTHPVDFSQWHVYGFEWTATGFKGYVDGKEIYATDGKGSNPSVSMHQTIQLDNLTKQVPAKPAKMEVDWVHMYAK